MLTLFVFDGDGINIIVTNTLRRSKRLILDCLLTGEETENKEQNQ